MPQHQWKWTIHHFQQKKIRQDCRLEGQKGTIGYGMATIPQTLPTYSVCKRMWYSGVWLLNTHCITWSWTALHCFSLTVVHFCLLTVVHFCSLTVSHFSSLTVSHFFSETVSVTVEHLFSLTVEHCRSFTVEHFCSGTFEHSWWGKFNKCYR